MKSYHWDDLESYSMQENFLGKLITGRYITIARTETEAGSQIQRRCYPHEVFIMIIYGLWKVKVKGRTELIGTNQILHIPPYQEYDIEALDRTLAVEIQAQPTSHRDVAPSVEDENYLWGV